MTRARATFAILLALATACAAPSRASIPVPEAEAEAPASVDRESEGRATRSRPTDDSIEVVSEGSTHEPLPESETQRARAAENCPSGRPQVKRADALGTLRVVARDGYALVHASALRVPLFVCEHVTVDELSGPLHGHRPHWQGDPALPPSERAEDSDYKGSGYDRGHMAPVGDQTADERARHETFYFSNAVPQDHAMNEGVWNALEQDVRELLRARGGGFVVTGPIFGSGEPTTIGEHRVAVPPRLYKIVVVPGTDDSLEAFALVYENRAYPAHEPRSAHLVAIEEIERLTGLDFLPELEDATERAIESRAAAAFPP